MWKSLATVRKYLWRYRGGMALGFFCLILKDVAQALQPLMIKGAVDAFGAAFPCGSITGAPKIRAMQILDSMEPVPRGVAMGAIGYFGFDGDADWNVAIRTIKCTRGEACFHVGGGIVAGSTAAAEDREIVLKSRGIGGALGL